MEENNINEQTNKKSNKNLLVILGSVIGVVVICIIILLIFKNTVGINQTKPDKVAKKYVEEVIKKDYKNAMNYLYVPDRSFINYDDYIDYLSRKDFLKKLVNKKVYKVEENRLGSEEASFIVSLKNEENEVESNAILIHLKKDGTKWYVDESDFYVKNYEFSCPGGAEVLIDGVKVDKKYIKGKTDTYYDKYVIPAIAKEKKKFEIKTKLGSLEKEITPVNINGELFKVELTDEELTKKAYNFVQNTWNEMYKMYLEGKDVSEVRKFFVDSIGIDTINVYYKDAFDSITKGSSGYKYVNYNLIKVISRKGSKNYISGEDIITLNFGYTLTWNWEFSLANNTRSMNRYSNIRLRMDGDSFKIQEVTDEKLFTWSNDFTSDF